MDNDGLITLIKKAIKDSCGENWGWDGENEYPYDEMNEELLVSNILKLIKSLYWIEVSCDVVEELGKVKSKQDK